MGRNPRQFSCVLRVARIARTSPYQSKSSVFRIPEAQRIRILERHIRGQSIREISAAEHRARETVARVVHSSEMNEFLEQKRSEFLALADDAIEAVRDALRNSKDSGRLALEVLRALGIMPSLTTSRPPRTESSLQQQRKFPSANSEVGEYCERLARVAVERNKAFGMEISEIVAEQHDQSVSTK